MPSRRALAIVVLGGANALLVPPTPAQTLLWSARYDSSPNDQLGRGKPFLVDGSGGVILAGRADTDFLLVRFGPDGSLDQSRRLAPPPYFDTPNTVTIDAEGRAVWAGTASGPCCVPKALLWRLGFQGPGETLHSATEGPGGSFHGDAVEAMADGGLLLGLGFTEWVNGTCLGGTITRKIGGTGPEWSVGDSTLCGGAVFGAAPDAEGGALVTDSSTRRVKRIAPSGTVVWSRSSTEPAWPWQGPPRFLAVDGAGNALASGVSPSGDIATTKTGAAGAELWRKTFGGVALGLDLPGGMAVDGSAGVYLTGFSASANGYSDYVTLKYDGAGNVQWLKIDDLGSDDEASGVAVDGSGNVWVTGRSASDIVTLKYDAAGTRVFSHRFTPPGPATMPGVALDNWGNATVAFTAAGDILVLRYGEAPVRIGPLSMHTVEPCRAFDSRVLGLGGPNPLAGPSDQVIPLAGVCGVPASARAASLNVTAVAGTHPGNLVLFPAGQTASATSVINYAAGQTRANNAAVGLGPNAGLVLRVSQGGGSVHVLLDVVAYWQ